jgi:P4 family phage/plasmid primase-like protien
MDAANPLLDAALRYAENGVRVFPCDPNTKKPLTPNGYKNATTNADQIRSWWRTWPTAMIGMPTGEINGCFALDVDQDEAKGHNGEAALDALIDREGPLPETAVSITPRGGRHFFFEHPGGKVKNSASIIGDGLDIRGDGGYVILPPSVRPDGAVYKWVRNPFEEGGIVAPAPDWLLRLVAPPVHEEGSRQRGRKPIGEKVRRYVEAALKSEVHAVETAPEGKRNDTLNTAAFNLGQLVGAGVLDEATVVAELTRAAAGYAADDGADAVEKTIASGLAAGIKQPRDLSEIKEAARRTRHTTAPSTEDYPVNEDGIARAFAEKRRDALRYCHSTGAWFAWVRTRWLKEETKLAFSWARELCRQLNLANDDTIAKASTAGAVERYAQADRAFAVTAETWDADPFLLNTPDGTVDLRTGELRPHRQDDYCTKQTLVGPAVTADHPRWSQFLKESTRGDVDLQRFLRQIAGYGLTGDVREHALFFVWGGGGNGKSVFLNTVTNILDDYATTAAMETFTASRSDRHPTDMAMLRGARLVSVSETEEGRAWAESRIKSLTGGDPITARFMRQDFFTYKPQFKLLIVGNHKPVLRNVDDAARRRFNIIPFVHKPPAPDRQLEAKLRAEYPAILRWMIDGCLDWQRNGLVRPKIVTEATASYFEDQDVLQHWIDECCQVGATNYDTRAALYESWEKWAKANGEQPGSAKAFTQKMVRAGFRPVDHTPGNHVKRGFAGIYVTRTAAPSWAAE